MFCVANLMKMKWADAILHAVSNLKWINELWPINELRRNYELKNDQKRSWTKGNKGIDMDILKSAKMFSETDNKEGHG
jgi:hypothetical protein